MTRVQGAPKTAGENGEKEAVSPHPEGFQRVSQLPGIRNACSELGRVVRAGTRELRADLRAPVGSR